MVIFDYVCPTSCEGPSALNRILPNIKDNYFVSYKFVVVPLAMHLLLSNDDIKSIIRVVFFFFYLIVKVYYVGSSPCLWLYAPVTSREMVLFKELANCLLRYM